MRTRLLKRWRRYPGGPNVLSTAGSFSPGIGPHIAPAEVRGYFLDFRFKARSAGWPPERLRLEGKQVYVALAQWALGCYERYLGGEGEEWLAAATAAADHLVAEQERGGSRAGGWTHRFNFKHTFAVRAPWLSAMAQGEGASLLVRIHRETRRELYAEAAIRALEPMRVPAEQGGVRAELAGGFFPEEYPTRPASFVLNGCLFALWGCHDVGVSLNDQGAAELFNEGCETLARELERYDTGYWSRYDLYPHPVVNIASSAYHRLHITQLEAMARLSSHPQIGDAAARFETYAARRVNRARAFARKVLFRLAVPRNELLAKRLPWLGHLRV